MPYSQNNGGETSTALQIMIITARSASAVQLELITAGVFMVDLGKAGLAANGYRFQVQHVDEVEQFVTLAQVKAWAKYNLSA